MKTLTRESIRIIVDGEVKRIIGDLLVHKEEADAKVLSEFCNRIGMASAHAIKKELDK